MLSEAEAGKAMRNQASGAVFARMAQPRCCLEEGSCLCWEPWPAEASSSLFCREWWHWGWVWAAGWGCPGLRRLLLLRLGDSFMPGRSVAGLGWFGFGFLLYNCIYTHLQILVLTQTQLPVPDVADLVFWSQAMVLR